MSAELSQKTGTPSEMGSGRAARNPRQLLLMAVAVTLVLNYIPYADILLYPLRLFVTFIHESGHALAAIASGGSVEAMRVFSNGEGVTGIRVAPWWAWFSLSGGYLGTTVFGACLLLFTRVWRKGNTGRAALYLTAGWVLLATILWVSNPITNMFTLVVGLLLTAILMALGRFLSPRVADFVAAFLEVECCLNALTDLRILLYLTTNTNRDNDAVFMSHAYGGPPAMWAVLWAGMALGILGVAFWSYWRAAEKHEP